MFLFIPKNQTEAGSECKNLARKQKDDCVKKILDSYISKNRIKESLDFLHSYANSDTNYYSDDCHGMAHYIGDKAFLLHNKGIKFDVGQHSNICVYGFYHAFTSSFILAGKGSEAKDFCLGLEKNDVSAAQGCYHGIGHGSIYDYNQDYGIKDPLQIIQKSVILCKTILGNLPGVNECITGVYDGIGDVVLDDYYKGLTPSVIYGYCLTQEEKYKPSCYENISHLVFRKTRLGFSYLVNYVMNDRLIKYKTDAIGGLSTIYIVDLKGGNINDGISACMNTPGDIRNTCLRNMVMKLGADAPDEGKYDAVRNFCGNSLITGPDRVTCFNNGIVGLLTYYSRDKILGLCNSDKVDFFRSTCLNQLNAL